MNEIVTLDVDGRTRGAKKLAAAIANLTAAQSRGPSGQPITAHEVALIEASAALMEASRGIALRQSAGYRIEPSELAAVTAELRGNLSELGRLRALAVKGAAEQAKQAVSQ